MSRFISAKCSKRPRRIRRRWGLWNCCIQCLDSWVWIIIIWWLKSMSQDERQWTGELLPMPVEAIVVFSWRSEHHCDVMSSLILGSVMLMQSRPPEVWTFDIEHSMLDIFSLRKPWSSAYSFVLESSSELEWRLDLSWEHLLMQLRSSWALSSK